MDYFGKKVSKEQALAGLGDPKTWDRDSAALDEEFNRPYRAPRRSMRRRKGFCEVCCRRSTFRPKKYRGLSFYYFYCVHCQFGNMNMVTRKPRYEGGDEREIEWRRRKQSRQF